MISPEEIRRKAINLYSAWQAAWLSDEAFFPKVIPSNKRPDHKLSVAIESIQRLRAGSKEQLGYGYSVRWKEKNSRLHGRNLFPDQIVIETPEDFLRLIGRQQEFQAFTSAVERIRKQLPALEPWVRSHRMELIASAGELEGLLAVVDYFIATPRPDRFARELPIPVDTKFIERNRSILRSWLDTLLPPHTIRADEEHFERRFGLRYAEPLIFIRSLDDNLLERARLPWREFAVPLHTLAENAIGCDRVLIVENKVNLLTLPPISGAIALGGLGNSVTDLRYLKWLASKPIWYWGDLDVEGFEILARLRSVFPQTKSLLMNEATVREFGDCMGVPGSGRSPSLPAILATSESSAFQKCAAENLRIEQERIPQTALGEALRLAGLT